MRRGQRLRLLYPRKQTSDSGMSTFERHRLAQTTAAAALGMSIEGNERRQPVGRNVFMIDREAPESDRIVGHARRVQFFQRSTPLRSWIAIPRILRSPSDQPKLSLEKSAYGESRVSGKSGLSPLQGRIRG